MRRMKAVVLTQIVMLLSLNVALGGDPPKPDARFTAKNLHLIEKNIDQGLSDADCPGLQESAAAVLHQVEMYAPDYSYSESVIPLMAILQNDREKTSTRILAAAALYDLDSSPGDFAIETTARFCHQQLVKRICSDLMRDRVSDISRVTTPLYKAELADKSLHHEDPRFTVENLRLVEKNIVDGLKSTADTSLQASAAKTMYEIECYAPAFRFSSAIIPLMAIVKNHDEPVNARVWAARALHAIHSARGDFAIEMTAKFSNQPRVRTVCAGLSASSKS